MTGASGRHPAFTMKRVPSRELLDDDAGTPVEVAGTLADIGLLNRYCGGVAATTRMIERVAWATGRSHFSVLEVAAGTGDLPQSVRTRLQRSGIGLELMLLDRCSSHMGDGENKVVGDALALPFRDGSFDLISCCLFIHHLTPEEVSVFVKEALRCSRVAVLINDLVRHPLHLALANAGRLIYRSRLTCNDAPASVRQSYTTEELREMLESSSAPAIEITRHFFYRMGAVVWKNREHRNGKAAVNA
jgi:ubiquinone/menaquinone biosynthesis C-methylase UbiE